MINILYSMPKSSLDKEHGARYLIIGGTPKPLWRKFEERFNIYIQEGYSQTEDPLPFLNPPEEHRKIGSFGVPVFPDLGHEVRVVDESGRDTPLGKPGELIRRSPATMLGYWRDPARTSETIIDGWLYSGDIVIQDSDGYTYFVERKKFIIRRSGENIAAWEVEAVIKLHPKVQDVAVIPVEDPFKGEEIKAIIKPKPDIKLDPTEIIEWTSERLAVFKVPRYIELTEELPYTPTGRVKKWELKELEKNREDHGWDRYKYMGKK
jgi:crotonobetaine/carnitine-CoA ligase